MARHGNHKDHLTLISVFVNLPESPFGISLFLVFAAQRQRFLRAKADRSLDPGPEAILGGNPSSTFGVMDGAEEGGSRISEDLTGAGFDDTE
jgi:DNA-binding LacI/PurR family transcriptional regulator